MTKSCPDWRDLCKQRENAADDARGVADDAPEWRSALDHFDRCPACQAEAPAFDPMLMFHRLPVFEVDADGVEAMKQAVAGMRRGQTIEHRHGLPTRPWLRAAALAAVLLGSLMLRGAGNPTTPAAPMDSVQETVANDIDLWHMPLVETADPTYGSIIQVVDDDISLVLVVASEADV